MNAAVRDPSAAEWAIWHAVQAGAGSSVHLTKALLISGSLDIEALDAAVQAFTIACPVLRFRFRGTTRRLEVIEVAGAPATLTVHDVRSIDERERLDQLREFAGMPFDLGNEVPFRLLVQQRLDGYLLMAVGHHIAMDGTTLDDLIGGLLHFACGGDLRVRSAIQHAQRRSIDEGENGAADWLAEFEQDRPWDDVHDEEGAVVVERSIPLELSAALRATATESGMSVSHALFSIYAAVLHAWADAEELLIMVPVDVRRRADRHAHGMGVNSIAVPCRLEPGDSFPAYAKRLHTQFLSAYRLRDVAITDLARACHVGRRADGSSVLTDYEFNYMTAWRPPEALSESGLSVTTLDHFVVAAQYDLSLSAVDHGIDGITLSWHLRGLGSTAAGQFLHGAFCRFLLAWCDGDGYVDHIPLVPSEMLVQLLEQGTGPNRPIDTRSVTERALAHCSSRPAHIAVETASEQRTYGELAEDVARCRRFLALAGVRPGSRVAVFLERDIPLVVTMLALWAEGAVYVPLDRANPATRLGAMISEIGTQFVVVDGAVPTDVASTFVGCGVVILDLAAVAAPGGIVDQAAFHQYSSPRDPVYVMFTSGSTGSPKALEIHVQGFMNHLDEMIRFGGLHERDVFGQLAPLGFDVHIWQLIAPLIIGGTLRVLSTDELRDPLQLGRVAADSGVTVMQAVPTYLEKWHYLAETSNQRAVVPNLRVLFVTGEAFSSELARRLVPFFPGATMINAYGPAEASDDVALHVADETETGPTIPVGSAVANTSLYLVDRWGRLRPPNKTGELAVGGVAVGNGYIGTDARPAFRLNPWLDGGTLYFTGDVCTMHEGVVRFLGRRDDQVKVGGRRIELGEIESVCASMDGVVSAAVCLVGSDGDARLVGFVTGGPSLDIDDVRVQLRASLPAYMVPRLERLDRIPLTPNGKIDRRRLSIMAEQSARRIPSSGIYDVVRATWLRILGASDIEGTANFFAAGGDSLRAIEVVADLRSQGVRAEIASLYESQTLNAFVEAIESTTRSRRPSTPVPLPAFVQWHLGPEGHTFVQGVRCRVDSDEASVHHAVGLVVQAHPVLAARLANTRGVWTLDPEDRSLEPFGIAGVSEEQIDEVAFNQLSTDRLVGWATAVVADGVELALVAHHAVVDTHSWILLLSDLQMALDGLSLGEPEWNFVDYCSVHASADQSHQVHTRASESSSVESFQLRYPAGVAHDHVEACVLAALVRSTVLSDESTAVRVGVERDMRFGARSAAIGVGCYASVSLSDILVDPDDGELVHLCSAALGPASRTPDVGSVLDILVNVAPNEQDASPSRSISRILPIAAVPQLNARSNPAPIVLDLTAHADLIRATLTFVSSGRGPTRLSRSVVELSHLAERLLASVPAVVLPEGHDMLGLSGTEIAGLLNQLEGR